MATPVQLITRAYTAIQPTIASDMDRAINQATGKTRPAGHFDGPRWLPDTSERRDCCSAIRYPSRSWPWSLYRHCCSLRHISNRYGVDYSELKTRVDALKGGVR